MKITGDLLKKNYTSSAIKSDDAGRAEKMNRERNSQGNSWAYLGTSIGSNVEDTAESGNAGDTTHFGRAARSGNGEDMGCVFGMEFKNEDFQPCLKLVRENYAEGSEFVTPEDDVKGRKERFDNDLNASKGLDSKGDNPKVKDPTNSNVSNRAKPKKPASPEAQNTIESSEFYTSRRQ